MPDNCREGESRRKPRGYDAVLCPRALSNDPLGDINPAATLSGTSTGELTLPKAHTMESGHRRRFHLLLLSQPCTALRRLLRGVGPRTRRFHRPPPYGQARWTPRRVSVALLATQSSARLLRHAARTTARRPLATAYDIFGEQPQLASRSPPAGCPAKPTQPWRPVWCTSWKTSERILAVLEASAQRAGVHIQVVQRRRDVTTCQDRRDVARCRPRGKGRAPSSRSPGPLASLLRQITGPRPSARRTTRSRRLLAMKKWSVREINEILAAYTKYALDYHGLQVAALRPAQSP